jgi:hypothetical protein
MTPTSQAMPSASPAAHRPGSSRATAISERLHRSRPARRQSVRERLLDRYTDPHGRPREVLTRDGAAGSMLVIDRDRASLGDQRLVAHLGADEPTANAALVCGRYLHDLADGRGHCRALTDEDALVAPFDQSCELEQTSPDAADAELVDRVGLAYALEPVRTSLSIPELRWCRLRDSRSADHRRATAAGGSPGQPLSVRDATAALESYEPVRTLTLQALARQGHSGAISTTVLRAELSRVQESPIVLNRRLREVVLATVAREQLSMSEIAIRCGRVKRDRRGNESGETSWLARRIGLLPEGGRSTPTPWVHSDVLALIARHGLGISPREVELC